MMANFISLSVNISDTFGRYLPNIYPLFIAR